MPLELPPDIPGTLSNPHRLCPQLRLIDHLFNVAKPIRPLTKAVTRDGSGRPPAAALAGTRSCGLSTPIAQAALARSCRLRLT